MRIKKWALRILLVCLVVSAPMCTVSLGDMTAYGATGYKDVASKHWAYENISKLSGTGLLNGYPDGTFRPSKDVSYGEFIKMAVLASGKKPSSLEKAGPSHWAFPYYEAALTKEYFTKDRIGLGKLSYPIPRRDMALLLSQMLGEWDIGDHGQVLDKIKDMDYRNPDEYHVVKIYDAGILTGYPDGTFRPEGTLNRAEAAAVITRFMDTKRKRLFPVPEAPAGVKLLPIETLIPNHENFYPLKDVKYYWITNDDPYTYEKMRNYFGTAGLYIYPEDRSRKVLFIVGNKALHTSNALATLYWETGAEEGSDLPDFDYIAVYTRASDTVMLIPSPFR